MLAPARCYQHRAGTSQTSCERHDSVSDLDSTTLREYLSYDPDTGVFTWIKKPSSKTLLGAVAGTLTVYGYLQIGLHKKLYKAHRLAWFYYYGRWPSHNIDHINGCRTDNRIANLRDVPPAVNNQNQTKPQKGNAYLGVHQMKGKHKWRAAIHLNGKSIYIGSFDTPEAARDAYIAAKRKLHAGCMI